MHLSLPCNNQAAAILTTFDKLTLLTAYYPLSSYQHLNMLRFSIYFPYLRHSLLRCTNSSTCFNFLLLRYTCNFSLHFPCQIHTIFYILIYRFIFLLALQTLFTLYCKSFRASINNMALLAYSLFYFDYYLFLYYSNKNSPQDFSRHIEKTNPTIIFEFNHINSILPNIKHRCNLHTRIVVPHPHILQTIAVF